VCRERLGVGLAEGKSIIDTLAKGETRPLRDAVAKVGPTKISGAQGVSGAPTADPFEQELIDMISRGGKLKAIRRYREHHGTGLAEAKHAVESLMAEHGVVQATGGCGILPAVIVGLIIGLGIMLVMLA